MAAISLRTIATGIQTVLLADASLAARGVKVEVEPDFSLAFEYGVLIAIYPDRWDAPAEMQRIGAGRRLDKRITFSLWICSMGLDLLEATRLRDEVQGEVELALMSNRRLNNTVATSWPAGGEYLTVGPGNEDFVAMVELRLVCDAIATV